MKVLEMRTMNLIVDTSADRCYSLKVVGQSGCGSQSAASLLATDEPSEMAFVRL